MHPNFSATIVETAPPETKQKETAESIDAPTPKEAPTAVAPPEATPASGRAPIRQQALGKMGAGIQKATHVARDVEGNVAHRVQKLRDVSSVVIDEASYDASLRFVLVAAALFILFLVILLLSKVIT